MSNGSRWALAGVFPEFFQAVSALTRSSSLPVALSFRIKGWWVSHHYVSTFLSGVMLTW